MLVLLIADINARGGFEGADMPHGGADAHQGESDFTAV